MPLARTLQTCLRLILALTLGLGPLGASVLAASLHAPLCGCAGCGAEGAGASCCEVAEPESSQPELVADEGHCSCALLSPPEQTNPAPVPRTCQTRSQAREQLERDQRGVEFAWKALPFPAIHASTDAGPPRGADEPGLTGCIRLRGSARAAALGVLLL